MRWTKRKPDPCFAKMGHPAPSFSQSATSYITAINHINGMFRVSKGTWWRPLRPRDVQHWRIGDGVAGVHRASCGDDPNVYLVTDVDESESACAQWIGR